MVAGCGVGRCGVWPVLCVVRIVVLDFVPDVVAAVVLVFGVVGGFVYFGCVRCCTISGWCLLLVWFCVLCSCRPFVAMVGLILVMVIVVAVVCVNAMINVFCGVVVVGVILVPLNIIVAVGWHECF